MALGAEVQVSFNDRNLYKKLEGYTCLKFERVKNTLYEQLMLHVWSHFFLDTPQANEESREIMEKVQYMKFAFWDHFAKVEFTSDINMSVPNLKPFEYWIVNNCTVRLSHLRDMGLTWVNTGKYLDNLETDISAFEAAGVIGLHRRKPNVPYEQWRRDIKYKIRREIIRIEEEEEEELEKEEKEKKSQQTRRKDTKNFLIS